MIKNQSTTDMIPHDLSSLHPAGWIEPSYAVPDMRYISKAEAEVRLNKLVNSCRNDVNRKLKIIPAHYSPVGKEMIITDYLLMARKFEGIVDAELYAACIDDIQSHLTPEISEAAQKENARLKLQTERS